MSPNKIAIFTHGIEGGAFTTIGTALVRGFKELGVKECDLVVLHATEEQKANYPDINVISLNQRARSALFPLARYMREHKPDVMFSMPWYFNVISIWARHLSGINIKTIAVEANIISLEAGIEHKDKAHLRFLPLIMRYSYPFGNGVIGCAEDVIKDLVENVKVSPRIPMTSILNPINSEWAINLANTPPNHPWFENKDVPVIMTAARLAKQKQIDVLLRAFAQVVDTMPARLFILGEGPLRSDLEKLCKELKIEQYVAMPGYDRNPYKFISNCDVFVLASAWEGASIILEEALACGTAVIVNDAPGGSKDIVGHGKFGMMVKAEDINDLAQGIIKLLSDNKLKKSYQEKARIHSQEFDYLNISKQYLDFCDSLS